MNDELAKLTLRYERLQSALPGQQRHPLDAGFAGGAATDRQRGRPPDDAPPAARWF